MNRSWDKGHFRLKPKMSWQRTVAKISSHWDQGRYSKGWGGGGPSLGRELCRSRHDVELRGPGGLCSPARVPTGESVPSCGVPNSRRRRRAFPARCLPVPRPPSGFSGASVPLPFLWGFSRLFWLQMSCVQAHKLHSVLRAWGCCGGCFGGR